MITTAVTIGSDGAIVLGSGPTYGILLAILAFHGVVCSSATRILARLNLAYVVVNGEPRLPFSRYLFTQFRAVGTTVAAIIVLYVSSGSQRVSAKDAFTLFENNTGWADGEFFLLGLLLHLTHEKIAGRFS
jgi:hypothetical protein